MYGRPEELRALARSVGCLADDVRRHCAALERAAVTTRWVSTSAEAMRHRLREQSRALTAAATRLDAAETALRAHAGEVERRLQLIAEAEERVRALVRAATAAGEQHAVRTLNRMADLPPAGSRSWLDLAAGLGR